MSVSRSSLIRVGALCIVGVGSYSQVVSCQTAVEGAAAESLVAAALSEESGSAEWAIAPDGHAVAYVRQIALAASLSRYGDIPTSELWIAEAPSWRPYPIGASPHRPYSYGYLSWSSDSRFLMYTRAEGSGYVVAIWSKFHHRTILESACVRKPLIDFRRGLDHPVWLDSHRILWTADDAECAEDDLLRHAAHGALQRFSGIEDAVSRWRAMGKGTRATVSVLESRGWSDSTQWPRTKLFEGDVRRRRIRLVIQSTFHELIPSPNGSAVALLHASALHTPSESEVYHRLASHYQYNVVVLRFDRGDSLFPITLGRNVIERTLQWSPDASHLAFIESEWNPYQDEDPISCIYDYAINSRDARQRMCGRFRATGAKLGPLQQAAGLHPATHAMGWLGNHTLAYRQSLDSTSHSARFDWYVNGPHAERIVLTRQFQTVPDTLYSVQGRTFVVADSEIYEFNVDGDSDRVRVHSDSLGTLHSVSRASFWVAGTEAIRGRADINVRGAIHSVAIDLNHRRVLGEWGDDVSVWGIAERTVSVAAVVSRQADNRQCFAVVEPLTGSTHEIGSCSELPNPPEFDQRSMSYRIADGTLLNARLTLPRAYRSDRQYPTVVIVYPGSTFSSTDSIHATALDVHRLGAGVDPSQFAALGYVALEPSIPFEYDSNDSTDLASRIETCTLDAVDAAVRLGIVDSSRLAIVGHSFGGFAVYSLLTRTNRFRVAVALAGMSDFGALYGHLPPLEKYRDWSDNDASSVDNAMYTEEGQPHLRKPPWEAPRRYIDLSPFYSADQIRTPLLIIQGDQDYIPLEQGEAMYIALRRQGKRVEFARYWGEGHIVAGYYNVLDVYHRIRVWLSTYLAIDGNSASSSGGQR